RAPRRAQAMPNGATMAPIHARGRSNAAHTPQPPAMIPTTTSTTPTNVIIATRLAPRSCAFFPARDALAQVEVHALLLVLDDLDVLGAIAHLHGVLAGRDGLELDGRLADLGAVDDHARALRLGLDDQRALAELALGLR